MQLRWIWTVAAFAGLVAAPTTARAIEVMCSNDVGGSCTVSNDPSPMFDCTCDGAPVGGTTGGSMNPWADYTEAELLEVCNDSLPSDCSATETTAGSGATDPGTGPVSESTPDSNPSTDPSGPGDSGEGATDSDATGGDGGKDKGCAVAGPAPLAALFLLPWLWRRNPQRR